MHLVFLILLSVSTPTYILSHKPSMKETQDRFLTLTPSERMQLMRQSAIAKYGQPHEVDYDLDPENFGGILMDYLNEPPPPEVSQFGTDPELDPSQPYNIQNVRSVHTRDTNSDNPGKSPYFQPLCETHRRTVHLVDLFYDYRPNHYEEVHCVYPYTGVEGEDDSNVCNEGGFHCIQLNRTIFVTKRAKGATCWELEPRRVPSGCECMWPKHIKGDIQYYH